MTNQNTNYPLSLQEFNEIYTKVPRLTVEIVVKSEEGVLLTFRSIEPYNGTWHIPGGTILYGERVLDAVKRVAKKELGVDVTKANFLTYIEYPSYPEKELGSPVGLVFVVEFDGEIVLNDEASEAQYFSEIPENTLPEHTEFINEHLL